MSRSVTRRRAITTALGVAAVIGAALLFQVRSDDEPSPFPALSTTARTPLEARLLDATFSLCNGECIDYEASAAACAPRTLAIDGRRWQRCRIRYAADPPADPPREPVETVCAALHATQGYTTRPLPDCLPA
jgi:hypothetical protein